MPRKPRHDPSRSTRPPHPAAYTLVELLTVIVIMGIFVGLVLTRFEPSMHDQLRGAAQVITADLAFARSLAVANNSQYKLTFDRTRHCFWLEHSGANPTLNNLPESPYRDPSDPSTKQTTSLQKLPSVTVQLELEAVRKVGASSQSDTTSVEFGPLGALNQSEDCWIWLAIGRGDGRRYLSIELDAITGLSRIGELQVTGPPSITAPASTSGS